MAAECFRGPFVFRGFRVLGVFVTENRQQTGRFGDVDVTPFARCGRYAGGWGSASPSYF